MSLIKNKLFSGFTRKFDKPLLYNEFVTRELDKIELLRIIEETSDIHIKENMLIDYDSLAFVEQGEKAFLELLMNQDQPMIILHDLCLRYDNKPIQIDFIVLTKNFIGIFETKKLSGDICINNDGSFSRFLRDEEGNPIKEEGIYSPYTQNMRNIQMLGKLFNEHKLTKKNQFVSRVIAANPKTIIDDNFGSKEVISNVLRLNEFNSSFKYLFKTTKKIYSHKNLQAIAEFLVSNSETLPSYLVSKYKR